jgi:hypothetical protein
MRTQEEKQAIVNTFSEPVSFENVVSEEYRNFLIAEFNSRQDKIFKNTGPITINIDLNDDKYAPLKELVNTLVGDVGITAAFFFYTNRPHVIHNDDTYELPQVYKGITIPLKYEGQTKHPYLCFFHQYYLEGPAKFFNGGVDFPEHYNKHVIDYSEVQGVLNVGIPAVVKANFISHLMPAWLEGLTFDRALPWKPGNALVFDSVRLHCSSNFLQQGIKSKLGISIFTKLNGDVTNVQ